MATSSAGECDHRMMLASFTIDWYAARAAGLVAYLLLSSSVALGLTLAGKERLERWPRFALEDVHRFAGVLAGTFIALHVVTIGIDSQAHLGLWELIVPFSSHYRPFWTGLGIVAAELLVALAFTNHYRKRLPHALWRRLHYLNFAVWLGATLHGLGAGTDSGAGWFLALYSEPRPRSPGSPFAGSAERNSRREGPPSPGSRPRARQVAEPVPSMSHHGVVRYLVLAVFITVALAGCGGDVDPATTPAGRAQVDYLEALYKGKFEQAYATLHPAYKRIVSRSQFSDCARARSPSGSSTRSRSSTSSTIRFEIPGEGEQSGKGRPSADLTSTGRHERHVRQPRGRRSGHGGTGS